MDRHHVRADQRISGGTMTRFTFRGDVTWGDGSGPRSFTYATENHLGFDKFIEDKAKDAVARAVQALTTTITHLNGHGSVTIRLANFFFLTGPWLTEIDLNVIRRHLTRTRNGMINGSLALKIHDGAAAPIRQGARINGGNGGNEVGHVGSRRNDANTGPRESKTPYHNNVWNMPNGRQYRAGAIHVASDRLNDHRLGCKTIIHEATHKYTGSEDYCYFDNSGEIPMHELTSKARAMQNADSLAWFTVWISECIEKGIPLED